MTKSVFIASGLVLFFCAGFLGAQAVPADMTPFLATTPPSQRVWHLGIYPYDNKSAGEEINATIAKGLIPVGVEVVSGKSIQILYSRNAAISGKRWILDLVEDSKKVESTLTGIIKKGFIPVDIAVQKEGIYILAVEFPLKLQGIQLFSSPGGIEALNKDIEPYVKKGFYLVGTSVFDGAFWALMLKSEKRPYVVATIWPSANNGSDFVNLLEGQTSAGANPFGFAVSKDLVYGIFAK